MTKLDLCCSVVVDAVVLDVVTVGVVVVVIVVVDVVAVVVVVVDVDVEGADKGLSSRSSKLMAMKGFSSS
jgi:hypothetical protein